MKTAVKYSTFIILLIAIIAIFEIVFSPSPAQAAHYNSYTTLSMIYNQGDCYSMQGMAVYGDYIYSAKINSDTDASAVIAKTHRTSGSTSYLTNASSGTKYFSILGHANDLEVAPVGGTTTMFVTSCDYRRRHPNLLRWYFRIPRGQRLRNPDDQIRSLFLHRQDRHQPNQRYHPPDAAIHHRYCRRQHQRYFQKPVQLLTSRL